MLIPARLRLVIAFAASAIACLAYCPARADQPKGTPVPSAKPGADAGPGESSQHATIAQLIEWAKQQDPNRELDADLNMVIQTGPGHTDTFTGEATGASGHGKGGKDAPTGVTGTVPAITTPGIGQNGAAGGTGEGKYKASANPENDASSAWWASGWFWGGVLCVLLAGALWLGPKLAPMYFPLPVPQKLPIAFAIAGGLMIFAAFTSPLVTMLLVVGAVVCIAGMSALHAAQASQTHGGLQSTTDVQAGNLQSASTQSTLWQSATRKLLEFVHRNGLANALDTELAASGEEHDVATINAARKIDGLPTVNPTPPLVAGVALKTS